MLDNARDSARPAGRLDRARAEYRLAADTAAAAGNLRRRAESLVSLTELTGAGTAEAAAAVAVLPAADTAALTARLGAVGACPCRPGSSAAAAGTSCRGTVPGPPGG